MEPPRKKLRAEGPSSTFSSTLGSGKDFRKQKKEEAPIDESIYDYDGAYDALKEAAAATEASKKDDKKPRYMTNILSATELRKRDQLRARDKLLQREREEEGDEFADKEKFVTTAYREQQEEVKKAEEDEQLREEREREKNKREGGGMRGFYRDLMDKDEQRHRDVVAAAAAAKTAKDTRRDDAGARKEKSEGDVARELRQQGMKVDINDEGQVADKRQLLKGGLNIVAKPKAPSVPASAPVRPVTSQQSFHAKGSNETARRERQTRMLEAQLEEAQAKQAEEEQRELEKKEEAVKSRKTKEDISSAKERYLQRKREAAAAAAEKT